MRSGKNEPVFSVAPAAAVLWGLLLYFTEPGQLFFLLPPVLVHELGHGLAMRSCGLRVDALRVELSGLCLRYHGETGRWEECWTAAAGPLAGFLYAAAVSLLPGRFALSGAVSLLLSLFNLLPVRPLDGGRIAAALLRPETARMLSVIGACAVSGAGAALLLAGKGTALLLAGVFLLLSQRGASL